MKFEVIFAAGFLFLGLARPPANAQEVPSLPPGNTTTPAEQQFGTGSVLTLEEVVTEGVRRNPGVQSALHAVQAQRHKVPQAKSLPDPMVL